MKKTIYEYRIDETIEANSLERLEEALNQRAESGCWELVGFRTINCLYPYNSRTITMEVAVFKRIKQ